MSGTTARLALPLIATGQAQKELAHSEGMIRLDALVQPVVQQVGLNTPPGSPTDGQAWIVGPSPTGAWAAQANNLAQRAGGAWRFYTRFDGLSVWDNTTDAVWHWNGTAWAVLVPRIIDASAVYDPPSLIDGAGVSTNVTVTGAALGDFAVVSFSLSTASVIFSAAVSAADTVTVRLQNETGGTLDLASGTLRVRVFKL